MERSGTMFSISSDKINNTNKMYGFVFVDDEFPNWVSKKDIPTFTKMYSFNPSKYIIRLGDTNSDFKIDATDASDILITYSKLSTETDFEISETTISKIEETFKITKSELDARPVLVWTPEHIESHFLTCFVALVITRLLENKLGNKYSIHKIIDAMKNYNSIPIEHDLCLQNYTDEIIEEFQKIFNEILTRRNNLKNSKDLLLLIPSI